MKNYICQMGNKCEVKSSANKVTQFRTINQTIKELKQADPNTCLTAYFLRALCKANKISYLNTNKKILFNYNSLLKYLEQGA